jgi:hypothetical protein
MLHSKEKRCLEELNDSELVAYWNILQTSKVLLVITDDPKRFPRHEKIVDGLLTERKIPHEAGKRITHDQGFGLTGY